MESVELYTDRLILKGITPKLIHELFRTKNKEEILHFFGTDEAGYEHYKDMHEKGMETHRVSHYFFLLIERENATPIGACGFHTWNKTHRRAELFYNLYHDEHKQKRYMTEALQVVLKFGYSQMGLHRVEALIADWNTASMKLLLRYGFTREGVMREDYYVNGKNEDSACYSLLKWEWAAKLST